MRRQQNVKRKEDHFVSDAIINSDDSKSETIRPIPCAAIQRGIRDACSRRLHAPRIVCAVCDQIVQTFAISTVRVCSVDTVPSGTRNRLSSHDERGVPKWDSELVAQYSIPGVSALTVRSTRTRRDLI